MISGGSWAGSHFRGAGSFVRGGCGGRLHPTRRTGGARGDLGAATSLEQDAAGARRAGGGPVAGGPGGGAGRRGGCGGGGGGGAGAPAVGAPGRRPPAARGRDPAPG